MIIKIPGSKKTKTKLLIILIILSIGIIIYEYGIHIKQRSTKDEKVVHEETLIPSNEKSSEEDAKEEVSQAEDKKEPEVSEEERNLYNEAYELFFSNKYVDAIKKADILVNKYPNNYFGYNIRGIAKSYNGDFENGMKDINKSLELNSKYGYALFNKGLTYELYNKMDDALIWYNKALEVEDYVWTYYGIASIYGRRGDIENTMKYLNRAIEIDSAVKEEAKTEKDFDPVRNYEQFKKAIN